jgi:hypothetical protein
MAMSKILRIRYETGGRFSVILDDNDIEVVATSVAMRAQATGA